MLTFSSHKASLLYVTACLIVATLAVAKLSDGQGSDQVLSSDRAHSVTPVLVTSAKLLEAQIDWPVTPRAQTPTLVQKASAAFAQAEALRAQREHSQALAHYQTALELAQKAEHRSFEALLWQQLGKTYQAVQDERQAAIAYHNAVALGRATDNAVVLGEAQADLARLYERQGNLKAALPLYRQAVVSLQKVGDQSAAQSLQAQTRKLETTIAQSAKARSAKAVAKAVNTAPKSSKPAPTVATAPSKVAPTQPAVKPRAAQPATQAALRPPVQAVSHAPERIAEPEFAIDQPDPEPPMIESLTDPASESLPLDVGTI